MPAMLLPVTHGRSGWRSGRSEWRAEVVEELPPRAILAGAAPKMLMKGDFICAYPAEVDK